MAHTQSGRRLIVTTPLGSDALLMQGFTGHEAISGTFFFQVECVAEDATKTPFDALLGQRRVESGARSVDHVLTYEFD